jgi:glycosyltransferase involved in cell wall biosynthesis
MRLFKEMALDNPLITITMSVYNGADTIKTTIESVIAQTYKNWNLIVRDNNSTDNTVDIVKSFADDRIKIIRNEVNKGASLNSIFLLEEITGEYFKWIDDDSYLYPENLEKEARILIENKNIVFVTCNTEYRIENGKTVRVKIPFKNNIVTRDEYIKHSLLTAKGSIQEGNQALYRSSFYKTAVNRYFLNGLDAGLVNLYSGYFYVPSLILSHGDMYVIHETLSSGKIEKNSYSLKFNQSKLQSAWLKLLQMDGYKINPFMYIWARLMIFSRSSARRIAFWFLGGKK